MARPLFAGIDISKARLEVALGDKSFSMEHTEENISVLVEKFKAASPQLIVVEATGGLKGPLGRLSGRGRITCGGRKSSPGQLAKTDKIDAQTLCRFCRGN